nr:uncharacterized protein LOC129255617 [Lytechinus pictus]
MVTMSRSRRPRVSPREEANKWCGIGSDQEGFEIKFINKSIGYGLYTTRQFEKDSFLLEYRGVLSVASEDTENEEYTFHFKHQGADYKIDASDPGCCLARWINDDHKHPNCIIKKVILKNDSSPHLCLFALRELKAGTELRYDYNIQDLPWRQPMSRFHSEEAASTVALTQPLSSEQSKEATCTSAMELTQPLSSCESGEASSAVDLTQPLSSEQSKEATCTSAMELTQPLSSCESGEASSAVDLTQPLSSEQSKEATCTSAMELTQPLSSCESGEASSAVDLIQPLSSEESKEATCTSSMELTQPLSSCESGEASSAVDLTQPLSAYQSEETSVVSLTFPQSSCQSLEDSSAVVVTQPLSFCQFLGVSSEVSHTLHQSPYQFKKTSAAAPTNVFRHSKEPLQLLPLSYLRNLTSQKNHLHKWPSPSLILLACHKKTLLCQ